MTTNSLKKTVLYIDTAVPYHDSKYSVKAYKSGDHDYDDYYDGDNMFRLVVHGKIIFTEYCIRHELVYLPSI